MFKLLLLSAALWAQPALALDEPAPMVEPPMVEQQAALLKQVQAKYVDVEVMRARFAQTTTSPLYGASEQSGKLTLQRPKKMRWEFDGDGKQFITDGKTMWIYSASDKQVIRYNDFGAGGGMAADALLQSLDKLEELFVVELLRSDANGHQLSLLPRDEASRAQVRGILLSLDAALLVREVTITDAYDGETGLTFEGVTLGGEVDESVFSFQVPAGVEVVDASG